jgi:hypothetical protein
MSRRIKVEFGTPVKDKRAYNWGSEKEMISSMNVLVVRQNKIVDIMTVRWYMGRSSSASKMYCSLWIHPSGGSSGGTAYGGGYDKRSASFADALTHAGVAYTGSLSGAGMGAVRDACEAIARKLGYRSKVYFVEN